MFGNRLHVRDAGLLRLGATVPVRYDSADRSKIAVDEARIRGERETGGSSRKGTAPSATVAETPLPSGPAAQLEALREQLKELDARGSERLRENAPREDNWRPGRRARCCSTRPYRALKRQHPEWDAELRPAARARRPPRR